MTLLYLLQGIKTEWLDYTSLAFLCMGSDLFFLCASSVIYWSFSKKAAIKILFSYVLSCPFLCIAGAVIRSPFPWETDGRLSVMGLISTHAAGYSLPSLGLFTITLLCIGIFVNNSNLAVKISCLAITVLTVFSYLYLGLCSIWSAAVSVAAGSLIVTFFSRFVDGTLFDIRQYPAYLAISSIPTMLLLVIIVSLYLNGIIDINDFSVYLRITSMNMAFLFSWFFESNFINFSIRCSGPSRQFLKSLLGSFTTLVTWFSIYIGLTLLIPGFWPAAFISNFLVTLGAFSAYPIMIKKVFS